MPLRIKPTRRRFKLRTLLLAVSLVVLVIPLAGVYIFRIYENELVKQTELELIAQAALIAAMYKNEVQEVVRQTHRENGYGIQLNLRASSEVYYRPIKPQLNLSAYVIKARPPEAVQAHVKGDDLALAIGARLTPILLEAQRTTLAGVRLLDFQGIITGGRDDIGKSLAHIPEVQEARAGRYSSAIRERIIHRPAPALASISRGTGIRVFVAYPITSENRLLGVVLLSRTPNSILEHLYSQREKVALVAIVILLLVILLVAFTSYAIARPVHALIQQTRQFASGDKKSIEPLASPVTEELALLSESFAEMARSLEYRAQYIRDFATHVSHEFKTPLTGIQGAVELLQEHLSEMPAEKRARFLANIAQDADRLKRLVDRLLEMARADVIQPTEGTAEMAPILAELRERYKDHGLIISCANANDAIAAVPPEIVETVITNLLDNSRQNGASRVDIKGARSNGDISVTVADNGHGISPANVEKIFAPFFTTHRNEGGTGLGLGIVRSLLKAYNGDITLEPGSSGATFRLTLPETRSRE